jgi:hypothetical protein
MDDIFIFWITIWISSFTPPFLKAEFQLFGVARLHSTKFSVLFDPVRICGGSRDIKIDMQPPTAGRLSQKTLHIG